MGVVAAKIVSRYRIDGKYAKRVEAELSVEKIDKEKDAKYASLKIKKEFKSGLRASAVVLLEGQIIRKHYKMKHESGRRYFFHEIGILKKLAGCDCAPKLLHYDRIRGFIYISHCGEAVMNSEDVQRRIKIQLQEIKEKFGVVFKGKFHARYSTVNTWNVPLNNLLVKDNKLYFIDFGSDTWSVIDTKKTAVIKSQEKVVPPPEKPEINFPEAKINNNKKTVTFALTDTKLEIKSDEGISTPH
jgi:predicted Ser/Thr protein kinase